MPPVRYHARRAPDMHVGALAFTAVLAAVIAMVVASLDIRPTAATPAPLAAATTTPTAAPSAARPVPELLHAEWFTQTGDPDIAVGEVADVTLMFRNVGRTDWVRGTPAELRLGMVGERPLPHDMKVDWPYHDRPAVQAEDVVGRHGLATFSFKVIGVAPGEFRLELRPVVDGVKWLEDQGVHVTIRVRDGA